MWWLYQLDVWSHHTDVHATKQLGAMFIGDVRGKYQFDVRRRHAGTPDKIKMRRKKIRKT